MLNTILRLKMKYNKILFFAIFVMMLCTGFTLPSKSDLVNVANSDYQWTGIAISKDGRVFVNYPTWKVASPFKVAELVDGKEVVYPSEEIDKQFVCVQSVVVDDLNRLWVLDPANPQFKGVVEGGPKLYQIDMNTDQIVNTYGFAEDSFTSTSYFNDVRIDTKKEIAYITDSEDGGIVVLDLESGESWLALNNTCSAVMANLDGIDFKATGKSKGITNSDGIELSDNGDMLYFTALTGNILYQIPTSYLLDRTLTSDSRCRNVELLNKNNVPTDGMVLFENKLYMADLPNAALWSFDLKTKQGISFDFDTTIRWADSFAVGADGYIYFTTSQINYPEADRVKYGIFKFKPID